MFNTKLKAELSQYQAQLQQEKSRNDAIDETMATIEFEPDGTILTASQPFLATVGYSLSDIQGKHHRMFCESSYTSGDEYRKFWTELASGIPHTGRMKRIDSKGCEIWLEASYFPVKDEFGKVERVMKIASDVTEKHLATEKFDSALQALDRSMATIEFEPDGTIIEANGNFFSAFGYSLEQIKGKHHRMFCKDSFYQENPNFWSELGTGSFKSGLFERVNSAGETVWLEASYNPVMSNGKVTRVIKIASDITPRIERNIEVQRITEVASETSQETSSKAQSGMKTLSEAVDTSQKVSDVVSSFASEVEELNQQFKNIENIVGTIKSIADQTNLLALNAAIEAARAGEQGRGFAVVADEVRQLAARTSESTEEIESMVLINHKMMENIMQEIGHVDKISNEGLVNISKVTDIMNDIQQGSESVAQAVAQLNKEA